MVRKHAKKGYDSRWGTLQSSEMDVHDAKPIPRRRKAVELEVRDPGLILSLLVRVLVLVLALAFALAPLPGLGVFAGQSVGRLSGSNVDNVGL